MMKNSQQYFNKPKSQPGFTIVELLIVVVVIAILAAITIVAYNGIAAKAVDSSMRSDLNSVITIAELDKTSDGAYAADAASANGGKGLKSSGGNELTYVTIGDGFCVSITNPKSAAKLRFKSADGQVTSGACVATVSTFAGSGIEGFADGPGATAQFGLPHGTAIDAAGNLYVGDMNNNRIRKITPAGVVSTLAGTGVAGFADGAGATAQFYNPAGVAVDAAGVVYVADYNNSRIRKITPSGVVSTLAGTGAAGFADGAGATARFFSPMGVAVDSSGVVYVADTYGRRIRKITPAGVVSTVAGVNTQGFADGNGAAALFYDPTGIAVDSSGMIYVADTGNHRIRKITPSGDVTTLAGSGVQGFANGSGAAAQFSGPAGITVDAAGTIYVTDMGNRRIRAITPGGSVSTLAGSGVDGFANGAGTTAQFTYINGITVGTDGTVYVAGGDWRIRKITQ